MVAPPRTETFLDEGRGGIGWGSEESGAWGAIGLGSLGVGGAGGGGGVGGGGVPTAMRGSGGERLLGSLTPVLVSNGTVWLKNEHRNSDSRAWVPVMVVPSTSY